jgi:polyisoprenoid-binding protein YceI
VTFEERLPEMSTSATTARPTEAEELVPVGSWRVTEASQIGFAVKGLGRTVNGRFGSFSGRLVHGGDDGAMASGSVDVASIDTGIVKRDDHLRSADFLDAANHPQITFASRRIIADGERYEIPGTLTIRGISQDVALVGTLLPAEPGDDSDTIRIAAETTVNRHDYGVKAPPAIEMFGLLVGAHVKIKLEIVAVTDARATIS